MRTEADARRDPQPGDMKAQQPGAVLVSYCPRCGAKCEGPGLAGIRCKACGATHDRVKELGDE